MELENNGYEAGVENYESESENENNIIVNINRREIKKIKFSGSLYRADPNFIAVGTTADVAYNVMYNEKTNEMKNIEIKYFTLNPKELGTYYERKGYTHETKWSVINKSDPLVLLDLIDYPTRLFVYQYVLNDEERGAMNDAFPLVENKEVVYRFSSEKTAAQDYMLLKALCRIPGIDGYYMKKQDKQNNNKIPDFHSEVGLCRKAFSKLRVESSEFKSAPKLSNSGKTVSHLSENASSVSKVLFGFGGKRRLRRTRKRKTNRLRKTRKV